MFPGVGITVIGVKNIDNGEAEVYETCSGTRNCSPTMKRLTFITLMLTGLTAMHFTTASAGAAPSATDAGKQGITGKVIQKKGNFMPGPAPEPGAPAPKRTELTLSVPANTVRLVGILPAHPRSSKGTPPRHAGMIVIGFSNWRWTRPPKLLVCRVEN